MGLGPVVPITSLSVGGNFNYSQSQSEGALTLIDLDGDGMADKVFKIGKSLYYRKHIADNDTVFHYGPKIPIVGADNFLKESSSTTSWGLQASAGCAYSGSWPYTTSTTSVYFADVNADGLPDLITDAGVLFNTIENDTVKFRDYYIESLSGDEQPTVSDTIVVGPKDCFGIIFDGEVNDSIACSVEWMFVGSFPIKEYLDNDRYAEIADSLMNTGEYDCVFRYSSDPDNLSQEFYDGRIDVYKKEVVCSPKSYDPNLETVKVWVAPADGNINITSDIKLQASHSDSYAQSKRRDGVQYRIQICKDVTADSQYRLFSSNYRVLAKDTILRDDTTTHSRMIPNVSVSKGDIVMFRLQSGDNRAFDKVVWEQNLAYTDHMETFNSKRDFIVSGDKYFQAHKDSSHFDMEIASSVRSSSDSAYLVVFSTANHIPTVDTFLLTPTSNNSISLNGSLMESDDIRLFLIANEYSSFDVRPHIRYVFPDTINNHAVQDTVDYYPPVQMMINNYNQTREDTVCHWLFGPLYRGWGQFAYNNDTTGNLLANDSIIDLSTLVVDPCLHPQDSIDALNDTSSIRNFVPATNTSTPQESSVVSNAFNSTGVYNPLSTRTRWVEMQPDSRHSA